MRILIISYYFPPYNAIGAVRIGKIAKYLHQFGHEVKVISAQEQPLQKTLPLEIPESNVTYTAWYNINKLPELLAGGREKVASVGYIGNNTNSIVRYGRVIYKTLFNFPDGQIGWFPFAMKSSQKVINNWFPDLIYASAMPYTSLLVAHRLSSQYKIPWVAELRDLWCQHHNYSYPQSRRKIEQWLERQVLGASSGLVTVSEPLANKLASVYSLPVKVILNGFDLSDYPLPSKYQADTNKLYITYTGSVYEGKQWLDPFFKALNLLLPFKENLCFRFYGRNLGIITTLANQYEVTEMVQVNPMIPYLESLAVQKESDILLLFGWKDSNQKGIYTGKLFEYIGSGKQILATGSDGDVVANLVIGSKLGVVTNDSHAMATQIKEWLDEKKNKELIPLLDTQKHSQFSREYQTRVLENFISEIGKKRV